MRLKTKSQFALRCLRRGFCYSMAALAPATMMAADAAVPAPSPAPTPAATAASSQPTAPAKAPLVIPDPVPDNVNPFTDKVLPVPLKIPAPLAMKVEIRVDTFDGINPLEMYISGPDFNWMFDPLDDWTVAPTGFSESVAFVYDTNTRVRLSLTLYKADFMPEITPEAITQYLAAVREPNPAAFVLLTAIPKEAGSLDVTYFSNFRGQGVAYALVGSTVVFHHQWFVDLNHQYVLVIDLACPQALVSRLDSQVRFTLGRSKILKGLGTEQPKPQPAPAPGSGTSAPKPTNG